METGDRDDARLSDCSYDEGVHSQRFAVREQNPPWPMIVVLFECGLVVILKVLSGGLVALARSAERRFLGGGAIAGGPEALLRALCWALSGVWTAGNLVLGPRQHQILWRESWKIPSN